MPKETTWLALNKFISNSFYLTYLGQTTRSCSTLGKTYNIYLAKYISIQ